MTTNISELTRMLIKPGYDKNFNSMAPKPCIDENKKAILFIGMNPAGNEDDAKRDNITGGLFLNYYNDFEYLSKKIQKPVSKLEKVYYSSYYKPIIEFFTKATGGKDIAWEWCNFDFEYVIDTIKKVNKNLNEEDEKVLYECHKRYSKSEYQLILRDLVYYSQTEGFKEMLKPHDSPEAKEITKAIINNYIDMFPNKEMLKLIYINFSKTCHFVKEALLPDGEELTNYGGIDYTYNGITVPVILAGRALSTGGIIDDYSKVRLMTAVKNLLSD